ncbi:hypothetical protein B0T25DRAFT_452522 [Lasiosphaeria hispida]|uniref:Uncharacterized protein n=1 Tax=Lasiosphaeria hispida TaxID=260671 RepID=A0AAJ0HMI2_9PEZI|nr:hypothetical protein B0T25DRAFT_452522 [Lasiosphaeria hispida]
MPATVRPSSQTAEAWGKRDQLHSRFVHSTSPEQLLSTVTTSDGDSSHYGKASPTPRLAQSSFAHLDRTSTTFATKNGLVHACMEAYNEHHNLVLRPDDIWLAILTQLSVYVNANAEALRNQFVSHAGQQELHIEVELTASLDHGAMAFHMGKLLNGSLKDPDLREWILPAFSTTEKVDQAVASIAFMGTMQKYFTYSWGTRCGIPAVTLLGDVEDWIEIADRCASRLGAGYFGDEAARWYHVLKPVLAGFVGTFHDPEGAATRRFWQGIVDEHRPNGSGCVTYSGWITAFCYWDEKGRCLHKSSSEWGGSLGGGVRLSRSEIPMGFSKVPVTLVNNGIEIPTEMVAGSVGGSGGLYRQRWDGYDTLQPESGWFMYFV